jgi:FixJ family two-component response regulator
MTSATGDLKMEQVQQPLDARVFIVDDDKSVRDSLARLIRSAGWGVETFAAARDFLDQPAYGGVGCAVLDVQMPEMTGPQLRDWMAAHSISMPIIFLTGHGDVAGGVQAMKRGAVDYLLKPVDSDTLLSTIRAGIERHAAEQVRECRKLEISARLARLSRRESEVMKHVIAGELNKQIAGRLNIALKTVKAHRARVMEKMEVHSVAMLVSMCDRVGIFSTEAGPGASAGGPRGH